MGLFGAGCQPSSTADPFGLRRISYGLVSYGLVSHGKHIINQFMYFLGSNTGRKQEESGLEKFFETVGRCAAHGY